MKTGICGDVICGGYLSTGVDKAVNNSVRSEPAFDREVPACREILPVDKLSDFSGIGHVRCINPPSSVDKPFEKTKKWFLFRFRCFSLLIGDFLDQRVDVVFQQRILADAFLD